MAKFKWGLLCERVIIDQERGSASYIDVIDHFYVSKLPVLIYQAVLSLLWEKEGDTDELQTRIHVKWPGADDITVAPEKVVFPRAAHRFNLTLNNIKLEQQGEMTFTVKQLINNRWKTVATLVYQIVEMEVPQG